MVNRKLDNAIRQVVTDALRNLNYPCYHSSLNVWGNEVIIAYPESPGSETYKELRGEGVIYHGRVTAVHYALYLPNIRKIHEE